MAAHAASLIAFVAALSASAGAVAAPETCLSKDLVEQVARDAGLSKKDIRALDDACIPPDMGKDVLITEHSGIPAGVRCKATQWCDSQKMCSTVCAHGSVEVDPWIAWATAWQRAVAYRQPFCYASLLGTHNTAITLADGYGNQDLYWQSFFKYLPGVGDKARLRTSNQWLSVTDQLRLGVRLFEADVHWFDGALRIAHCGGLHAPVVDALLATLNALSALLGQRIRWDTETVGCEPSLSSVPVRDQRHFAELAAEVADWLRAPENAGEFLVMFLDDEQDLKRWNKVHVLVDQVLAAFPRRWIMTPPELHALAARKTGGDLFTWPSINEMLAIGKRMLIVSRMDYGESVADLFFARERVCRWWEPSLDKLRRGGPPSCDSISRRHASLDGTFCRINDCKLLYGPLNCSFALSSPDVDAINILSPGHIKEVAMCGWNSISPDLLTPRILEATLWSWAPGEPRPLFGGHSSGADGSTALQAERAAPSGWGLVGVQDTSCVSISAQDGRWRTVPCDADIPAACLSVLGNKSELVGGSSAWQLAPGELSPGPPAWNESQWLPAVHDYAWALGRPPAPELATASKPRSGGVGAGGVWARIRRVSATLAGIRGALEQGSGALLAATRQGWRKADDLEVVSHDGCGGCCPVGFTFAFPENGKSNAELKLLMQARRVSQAMIRVSGPTFQPVPK